MWKFHNFTATQILREINFGVFRISERQPFLTFSEALNIDFGQFFKAEISPKIKIRAYETVKMAFCEAPNNQI